MNPSALGATMVRMVRALVSLLVLVLVLGGTPWLLWRVGRLDVAAHLGWSGLVHPGDAGALLLLVLTVLGWASWLFVAATVLSELVYVVSRERIDVPVPGSGWLRPVVAVLVVSIVGLVIAGARGTAGPGGAANSLPGTGGAGAGAPATVSAPHFTALPDGGPATSPAGTPSNPQPSHPSAGTPSTARVRAVEHSGSRAEHPAAGTSSSSTAPAESAARGVSHGDRSHRGDIHAATAHHIVQPHDDLWDLAQRLYADPTRWRDIAEANHLGADAVIVPGQMLRIPHLSQEELTRRTGQPAPDMSARSVVVRPGDTLTSLAQQHLGSASYWQVLQWANHTLVSDADRLQVGWTLQLPPRLPSTAPTRTTGNPSTGSSAPSKAQESRAADASPPTGGAHLPTVAPRAPSRPMGARPGGTPSSTPSSTPPSAARANGLPTALPRAGVQPTGEQRTPEPTERAAASVPGSQQSVDDGADLEQLAAILTGLGILSASGIAWGLRRRRREREFSRRPGRRAPVIEDADQLEFAAALRRADAVSPATEADLGQTAVVLGENRRRSVVVDLADAGQLVVRGGDDLVAAAGSAIVVALASAPWSDGVPVRVAGSVLRWVHDLDNPLVQVSASVVQALADLRRLTTRRASATDPQSGDAEEPPEIWIIDARELPTAEHEHLVSDTGRRAAEVGVHVVWLLGVRDLQASEAALVAAGSCDVLTLRGDEVAELSGERDPFVPSLVSEPARRALVELFDAAGTQRTEPAPWWTPDPADAACATPVLHEAIPPLDVAVAATSATQGDAAPDVTPVPDPARDAAGVQGAHRPLEASPAAKRLGVDTPVFELVDPLPHPSTDPTPGRPNPSRRPDTEHPEAAMARIPDVLAHPEHPTLLLLGPVELAGARGVPPTRATRQCLEYCAWLMEHPGQTSQAMARSLLVAEGTRRSNMSRLRTWLGAAPDGNDYLPDAYSGRIHLHPGVTSDWEHLQLLISAGVNRASDDALVEALELVRGAPLADAAPGQWHWAEELRTEMTQTLRDIAVVLADRATAAGDAGLARWACCRALIVAPDDELLLCARIRAEQLAGRRGEVERLVLQLTRTARMLGVDLADETVMLMQEVMEGRVRNRAATS